MKNRKFKIAISSMISVFALICICIGTRQDTEVIKALIALFGSIVLFYMGGNVGEHFAVSREEKKQ